MGPPPLPPKHRGSRDLGQAPHSTIHLRQRSRDAEVQPFLRSERGGSFTLGSSVETVVDLDDSTDYHAAAQEKGNYQKVARDEGAKRSPRAGYLSWEDRKVTRRRGSKTCIWVLLVLGCGLGGWLMGLATKDEKLRSTVGDGVRNVVLQQKAVKLPCNPYEQHGVLNVNLTIASENQWEPIDAPKTCQPVDYLSLLWNANENNVFPVELEFMRNRTIVLLGDSVDRDHNEHFCNFVGGFLEMIGVDHALSPPYPPGEEVPPEDYVNPWNGKREWPNFIQSRPFVCHIFKYNMRILNVFHYGFRDRTKMIEYHPHFYPPARVEDRIDQIVVPIVEGLGRMYNTSTRPDLFSMTPGYWGLLRQAVEDDKKKAELIKEGVSEEEATRRYDVWRVMSHEQRKWEAKRTEEILRYMAKVWPLEEGQHELYRKPKLLWRALHHIKEHHNIPFDRLQALDQIGRAVVEKLVIEGKAAEAGELSWNALSAKLKNKLGFTKHAQKESEAYAGGLGQRLKIDDWAALMMGQERYFRDDVHPLPLPGSFLYGNMLMRHLADAVREREGVYFRYEEDEPIASGLFSGLAASASA